MYPRSVCVRRLLDYRSIAVGAVTLCLVATFAGCSNLDQLAQLATTADQAKPTLAAIASDFKGSCDRQNLYIPPASPPDTPRPCVDGEDLAKLGSNLVTEQSVLLDYFDTLGKLASSDASGFTKSAGNIDTSFKDAGLNSAQQKMATSAGKLASAITDMLIHGYRGKKLLEIMQKTNGNVTTLANGLADQVAPDPKNPSPKMSSYTSLLENERTLMDSYYKIPLAQNPTSLTAILVSRQYQNDLDRLEVRESAARAYRKLMLSLAQAHAKLVDDSKNGHFDIKQIAKDLGPDVQKIGESVIDLRNDMR